MAKKEAPMYIIDVYGEGCNLEAIETIKKACAKGALDLQTAYFEENRDLIYLEAEREKETQYLFDWGDKGKLFLVHHRDENTDMFSVQGVLATDKAKEFLQNLPMANNVMAKDYIRFCGNGELNNIKVDYTPLYAMRDIPNYMKNNLKDFTKDQAVVFGYEDNYALTGHHRSNRDGTGEVRTDSFQNDIYQFRELLDMRKFYLEPISRIEIDTAYRDMHVDLNGLSRLRAAKPFTLADGTHIKYGDLGGCIENYSNLSQEGKCWVKGKYNVVRDNSKISGDCLVDSNLINDKFLKYASIYNSVLDGNVVVKGGKINHSIVKGNAFIAGNLYGTQIDATQAKVDVLEKADIHKAKLSPTEKDITINKKVLTQKEADALVSGKSANWQYMCVWFRPGTLKRARGQRGAMFSYSGEVNGKKFWFPESRDGIDETGTGRFEVNTVISGKFKDWRVLAMDSNQGFTEPVFEITQKTSDGKEQVMMCNLKELKLLAKQLNQQVVKQQSKDKVVNSLERQ